MKWKQNPAMKALAFIIAVASFAASAIMGWYQIMNIDVLWGDRNPDEGYTIVYLEQQDYFRIRDLISFYKFEAQGNELSIYQEQEKTELEERFDTDQTNLRWQVLDSERNVLYGNTAEKLPARARGLFEGSYTWSGDIDAAVGEADWASAAEEAVNITDWENVIYSEDWRTDLFDAVERYQEGYPTTEDALDAVFLSSDGSTELLTITDADGIHVYGPTIRSMLEANEYGYQYVGNGWDKVVNGRQDVELDVILWLEDDLPAADKYAQAVYTLENWQASRNVRLAATILCAVAGLVLTVCLCAACGHKRGVEGIYLNWFHRVPGDLLLLALFLMGCVVVSLFLEWPLSWMISFGYSGVPMLAQLLFVGCFASALAALGMGALVTFVARCKAHTLLRNTLIWRLCRWLWRLCVRMYRAVRRAAAALPLVWKVVTIGMAYILFTLLTFNGSAGLWLLVTAVAVVYLCIWALQWKRIRAGTREIIRGNSDYHIDSARMLPDLKGHADELNNLGQSISTAVEERMRSEHFKAELITNVSHDLKTPLTSIINYVDLLKKEQIDNPKAAEYIEVLDRKSQRLKKLTEDLVEASKASTGSLTVIRERLDLSQLLDQALAEYLERLEGQRLTVVRTLPEEPVWVEADGRHLWRVIDNLLSNCAKYALEGTRIYVEVQKYSDCAALSIKNISRDELNVPPETLMERFVRGDESRTAEGSGLGLSIAQSLTDLQQGQFQISIDGDLFKATVTLPLAEED